MYACWTVRRRGSVSSGGVGSTWSWRVISATRRVRSWSGSVAPPAVTVVWAWTPPSTVTRWPAAISVTRSAATVTGSWSPHIHSRCWCMRTLCDGVVDANFLSIKLGVCHLVPGLRCVVHWLEVDERKPTTAARMPVQHNLYSLQMTEPAELLL